MPVQLTLTKHLPLIREHVGCRQSTKFQAFGAYIINIILPNKGEKNNNNVLLIL
jgi:hypothetical protein